MAGELSNFVNRLLGPRRFPPARGTVPDRVPGSELGIARTGPTPQQLLAHGGYDVIGTPVEDPAAELLAEGDAVTTPIDAGNAQQTTKGAVGVYARTLLDALFPRRIFRPGTVTALSQPAASEVAVPDEASGPDIVTPEDEAALTAEIGAAVQADLEGDDVGAQMHADLVDALHEGAQPETPATEISVAPKYPGGPV